MDARVVASLSAGAERFARHARSRRYRGSIAIAFVLLVATLIPTGGVVGPEPPLGSQAFVFGLDTWLHLIGFGALSASIVLAGRRPTWRLVAVAIVLTTAFGALIELLQWPLPWRMGSVADVVANAVGAAVGGCVAFVGRRLRK